MGKEAYTVLGVMSGTSLDGVDIALCRFWKKETNGWGFEIDIAETYPYSKRWQNRLKEAVHFSKGRVARLNQECTQLLGELISNFIQKHHISELDAVCSHGHTIFHQPDKGITLQIGNLPELASYVGHTVVCDFRVQDVQMGGQGAPLVPIGDRLLFEAYTYCLNLGGFANLSYETSGNRIAYDVCPVNIVLNPWAEKLGAAYDDQGQWAREGTLIPELLKELNAIAFYEKSPPKSLGLEWVQAHIFPLLDSSNGRPKDVLNTYVHHVAEQLACQFKEEGSILITGGGAYNKFLMELLSEKSTNQITIPDNTLLEYKEALIFGLLGVLRLEGQVNCLASVTGATTDHSSGVIYQSR